MSMPDGSSSPANLMSDMEFYATGSYLSSAHSRLAPATLHETPSHLEDIIIQEWLNEFHPQCGNQTGIVPQRGATGHEVTLQADHSYAAASLSKSVINGSARTLKSDRETIE